MPDDVNLSIDGVGVTVPKGTLLVEAAKTVKQEIPVYCYHTKLGPAGLCRICLVEIEGQPKLQIACNTVVAEGMKVRTQGDRVDAGRAMVLELFLVNHPLDCPICDKGGECDLQDYAMAYARPNSDVADAKAHKPKAVDLGPTIVLDEERCIVCQRCVRFDEIIAGEKQLVVKDRGARDIIATASGLPYRHNFTGNVTELCPVGALTSKTYRFKSRPWDLNRTQTTCTQCPVGCQQFVDVRFGSVLRTMSVEADDEISDGWLCDRGRYNIGFYSSPDRLTQPLYKKNGSFVQIGWDDVFALWAKALRRALSSRGPSGIGAVGGGRLTNEEAYLLQRIVRRLGSNNLDWRTGLQRQATPGARGGALVDIERAKTIVLAGQSPEELAPVLWLRVLKAVRKNGARIIREPDANATSPVALVWDGVDLDLGRSFAQAFSAVDGVSAFIASEQANARGAEAMGMLPGSGPGYAKFSAAGRDTLQMFDDARDGKLSVLSVFGANPVRNASDRAAIGDALGHLEFLVVSDLFMTETASRATLVLPAKGAFEKSGTTLNLGGDVLPVNASLVAPEGPLSDFEMLCGLAEALGLDVPGPAELDEAVIAHAANAPTDFTFGDDRFAGGSVPRNGATHTILSGGGTWQHDPAMAAL
ncbi:MAG: molybdopterin-dependent oxidoreductase [Candidatus Eremiobacteraeota bacterium]|nr:molybdopterin-dependent oxidoreductase [Candidatus Eremiobacteraeota bacterium]